MTASPSSKYAVTFVFITVLLDMVGFGMIIPVQPAIIQDPAAVAGDRITADRAVQQGGCAAAAIDPAAVEIGRVA